MRVPIKIYLNEGEDSFFGFHNTFADQPRLRLAAAFDHHVLEIDTMPGTNWVNTLLEFIFEQLNIGGDPSFNVAPKPWTEQYRKERNRSLSVGDVVVIGEAAFSCENRGWTPISTEDLTEAIARFNDLGAFVR